MNFNRRSTAKAPGMLYARALSLRGLVYDIIGNTDKAISDLELSLQICRKQNIRDRSLTAKISFDLANIFDRGKRNHVEALKLLGRGFRYIGSRKDPKLFAYGLHVLSTIEWERGEYDKALEHSRKARDIFIRTGDKINLGIAYNITGLIYWNKRKYGLALKYLEKRLKNSEELKDRMGTAIANTNIGIICRTVGELPEALKYYMKAKDTFKAVNYRMGLASIEGNIGQTYFNLGKLKTAEESFKRCLSISEQVGYRIGAGFAHFSMGMIYLHRDMPGKAAGLLIMAEESFSSCGAEAHLPVVYAALSEAFHAADDKMKAEEYLKKAGILLAKYGNEEAEIVYLRCKAKLRRNAPEKIAVGCLKKAVSVAGKMRNRFEFGITLYELASALRVFRPAEAKRYAGKAEDAFLAMDSRFWLKKTRELLKTMK